MGPRPHVQSRPFTCKPTSKPLSRPGGRRGLSAGVMAGVFNERRTGAVTCGSAAAPSFPTRGAATEAPSRPTMPDAPTDTSKVLSPSLGSPLPPLLANLAASEGSPLIHGSERWLNQPVVGGGHGQTLLPSAQTAQAKRVCLVPVRPSLI